MYDHKRVLVALDGSEASEAVLRFILQIAGPLDMTVLLLRVLPPIPPVAAEDAAEVVLDDITGDRRDAEEYLAPIAAAVRGTGVEATWEVRRGRAEDEILAAARAHGADLIAMATHGRTGAQRLLFGSVAEAVLRRAPVPLFMIRLPKGPARAPAPSAVVALLAGALMLAVAATATTAAAAARPPSSAVELGEVAFRSSGCFNCHTIGKVGTQLGPDLSHIGTKYPTEYMARWLRDPALQRPHAHMPALDLTEAQVRALAAYLGSLE